MIQLPPISRTRHAVASIIDLVILVLLAYALAQMHLQVKNMVFGRDIAQAVANNRERIQAAHPDNPGFIYEFADPKPDNISQETFERLQCFDLTLYPVLLTAFWLYFTKTESSGIQATVGKYLAGLKVVDTDGERISSYRSSGRFIMVLIRCFGILLSCWPIPMLLALPFGALGNDRVMEFAATLSCGIIFILIVVRSGKRGQRIQDRLSGTRVVPRAWNIYRADLYPPSDVAPDNAFFRVLYLLAWLAVFAGPAYYVFK